MIKNVLTFIDGSKASQAWLGRAVDFCRQHGARLHITVLMERFPLEVRDAFTPEDALDTDFAPLGDDIADIAFPPWLLNSGVAVEAHFNIRQAIADADRRLYRAKRIGRNRVVLDETAGDDVSAA